MLTPSSRGSRPGARGGARPADRGAAAGAGAGKSSASDDYVAEVLEVVDSIPPGKVLTYGDVAELVGRGGPRQVGQVMSRWGSDVPWWRVLRADGRPPDGHEARALSRYAAEGTALRPGGERVDLRRARWTP